jgi:4-amino-4-deoxy-L-arabinose transferase and related glycosyltransferases of PMT family
MNADTPIGSRLESLLMHSWFNPLCFTVFIGTRFALLLFVPVEPSSDAMWYFSRAITIVEHGSYSEGGLPTAFWPVGYPAFLALLFTFTGPHLVVVQFANLVLAACTYWLLFYFTKTIFKSDSTARLSILLLTLYPNNAAYIPFVVSEMLYTCLLLFVSLLMLTRQSTSAILLCGIAFGFATLIKTQTLLLAPLLATIAYSKDWTLHDFKAGIIRAITISILMLAVIAPWTLRNYLVFDEFIPVSTNGGTSLLAGNNPSVVGDYTRDFSDTDPLYKEAGFSAANQVASDRRARELAKSWILENPGTFIGMMPKKFFRFWAMDGEGEWGYQAGTPWYEQHAKWFRSIRIVNQIYYFLLLGGFSVAIWRLLRTPAKPAMYYGLVIAIYFTLISLVFSGQSRYHFPVMPFVLAYAAWIGNEMLNSKKRVAALPEHMTNT